MIPSGYQNTEQWIFLVRRLLEQVVLSSKMFPPLPSAPSCSWADRQRWARHFVRRTIAQCPACLRLSVCLIKVVRWWDCVGRGSSGVLLRYSNPCYIAKWHHLTLSTTQLWGDKLVLRRRKTKPSGYIGLFSTCSEKKVVEGVMKLPLCGYWKSARLDWKGKAQRQVPSSAFVLWHSYS